MRLFGHELQGFAKALVLLVAVLLVSSGLCGLEFAIGNHAPNSLEPILIPLGVVELLAMLVSAAGIVIVLLVWISTAIYRRVQRHSTD